MKEIMAADPVTVSPETAMADAARLMRNLDICDVLVSEDGRLRGLVTDRDIAVRGVADLHGPDTPVGGVCSPDLLYCSPDDEVARAATLMRENAVGRLPVVDGERLVGVVSLRDLDGEGDPVRPRTVA